MNRYLAEAIGTFVLVFAGTGAIVVNDLNGGTVSHIGIALTFGLVVMSMIYSIGDISGAHINPAVTLGFWLSRRFPGRDVAPYMLSQTVGALAASGLIRILMGAHPTLGATIPSGTAGQSLGFEIVLSFILMFTILNVATGAKEKGITAGIAIGSVVGLEALFAGPVSGASMNPARSLAPALVSGQLADIWIYFVGPLIGVAFAVSACRCSRGSECCSPEPAI